MVACAVYHKLPDGKDQVSDMTVNEVSKQLIGSGPEFQPGKEVNLDVSVLTPPGAALLLGAQFESEFQPTKFLRRIL